MGTQSLGQRPAIWTWLAGQWGEAGRAGGPGWWAQQGPLTQVGVKCARRMHGEDLTEMRALFLHRDVVMTDVLPAHTLRRNHDYGTLEYEMLTLLIRVDIIII